MDRRKIKCEGRCCDAFRAWCKSDKGRAYIQQLMNVMGYEPAWIIHQMKEAYLWEADPDQPDRWLFSTFFRNWCRKGKKIDIDEDRRTKLISAEREAQLKEKHRSTGTRVSNFREVRDRRGIIQKTTIKKMGDL